MTTFRFGDKKNIVWPPQHLTFILVNPPSNIGKILPSLFSFHSLDLEQEQVQQLLWTMNHGL